MLLAAPAWLKLKGVAGHWQVQHAARVRTKPDGGPRLALQILDKLFTAYVYLLHPTRQAHTSTHLPIPLLSLGQRTGPLRVSALRGPLPAITNE